MTKTQATKAKKLRAGTKTKNKIQSLRLARADGRPMSLEDVIGLQIWAQAEGYNIEVQK